MSDDITKRQTEVLRFINAFRASEQCNPTCEEIKQSFGWSSANAAHEHLAALEKKGVIESRKNIFGWQKRSRGYRVLSPWDET